MSRSILVALALSTALVPRNAPAQFATPPEGAVLVDDETAPRHEDDYRDTLPSTARASLGPVLRANDGEPGLIAALDVGARRTGFRASAAFIQVGSEDGLSQYAGELWIDLVERGPLHPVLGAGAGLARLEREDGADYAGVGVASARLEYLLPIRDTDARAALLLSGALPAIRGKDAPEIDPWLFAAATLGVGF